MSRSFSSGAFTPQAKVQAKSARLYAPQALALHMAIRAARLMLRIYASLALMLAAKIVTIAVPYSFKWATDALSGPAQASLSSVIRRPPGLNSSLWGPAHRDGAPHPNPRRDLR